MTAAVTGGTAFSPVVDLLAAPDLSIVIPLYDEAESLDELHRRLSETVDALPCTAEILFVDDGSRDGSFAVLEGLYERDPRVRVIGLRRNFGKTAALLAGFEQARGGIVITLDADLQDDPKEIPRFLEAIGDDRDLVSGWKRDRHDPMSKTLPSWLFNLVVRRTTGIPLHDFNCGYKAYRREVLDELKLYGELHRFIPVMAYWKGYRIGELGVEHHARKFGRSKFGASRLFKGMLDFIKVLFLTRYMQRPLQLFGLIGALLLLGGGGGFLYLFVLKVLGQSVFQTHGPLMVFSGILIVSGLQLFTMGLLGEMQRHYSFRASDEFSVRKRLSRE
jgi:glycosyltransferase involved in cell wall biosynthesis